MNKFAWVAPCSRILLRVGAGLLAGHGLFSEATGNEIIGNPDVQMVAEMTVAAVAWAAVELWYVAARRLGWAT